MAEEATPRRGIVTYELLNRTYDNKGNTFPPEDKCVMAWSCTGNSNGDITVDVLKRIIFLIVGILEGEEGVY